MGWKIDLIRQVVGIKPRPVFISDWVTIPAQDAALDDADALGSPGTIRVPVSGILQSAHLLDPADQGNSLDVKLLDGEFTAAAADQAFSLSDADALRIIHTLEFSTFHDNVNNQDSSIENIGKAYRVQPEHKGSKFGLLHFQGIAVGTPTYGAGAKPKFRLEILPDE